MLLFVSQSLYTGTKIKLEMTAGQHNEEETERTEHWKRLETSL